MIQRTTMIMTTVAGMVARHQAGPQRVTQAGPGAAVLKVTVDTGENYGITDDG